MHIACFSRREKPEKMVKDQRNRGEPEECVCRGVTHGVGCEIGPRFLSLAKEEAFRAKNSSDKRKLRKLQRRHKRAAGFVGSGHKLGKQRRALRLRRGQSRDEVTGKERGRERRERRRHAPQRGPEENVRWVLPEGSEAGV